MKEDTLFLTINFPKELEDNYIKILSNTYYLNLKKVALEMEKHIKDSQLHRKQDVAMQTVTELYAKYLDETRDQAIKFFNIYNNPQLSARALVRSYVFNLSLKHPTKQKYMDITEILYQIEDNMSKGIIPEEFLDKSNKYYTDNPINVNIIHFKYLLGCC
jgi:hypothetical protein